MTVNLNIYKFKQARTILMFTGKKLSGTSIAQNIKKSEPISHSTRITEQILQKEKNIPSDPITK